MDVLNNSSVSRSLEGHTKEVNKSILTKEAKKTGEHHNASSPKTSITTFTTEVKDNDAELSSKNEG